MIGGKVGVSLLLVLSLALVSCTGVTKYSISRPQTISQDISITKDGIISAPEFKLMLRPTNLVVSNSGIVLVFVNLYDKVDDPKTDRLFSIYYNGELLNERPPVFYMEMLISAKVAGISLDLKEVALLMNGMKFHPSSYLGPMEVWSKANYSLSLCRKGPADQEKSPANLALVPDKDYCIAIGFKVPPPLPNTDFSVVIRGLRVNERDIAVPIITYETKVEEFYHP